MSNFIKFVNKFLIVFFLILIFIFISAKSYSNIMFENISNNFLRLHIVANTDSTEDQILKYNIRDAVLEYINPLFENIKDKESALNILTCHINEIQIIASNIAVSSGFNYPITVSVGNFYFPTKNYSKITLPEGHYDALKIELGKADGQNWWCVMFPSLCLLDTNHLSFSKSADKVLNENLSSEEYSVISNVDSSKDIKIKFKLIELFENI